MRTLFEIVDGAKDGNMPTHEECYWAMLALSALHYFDYSKLRTLCFKEKINPGLNKLTAEESFKRFQAALNKSPKEWVGPNNDPANPEYQKFRKAGAKILDKISNNSKDKTGYQPIPVREAERIANEYGKDIVVINAYEQLSNLIHTTTFGKTLDDKNIAAEWGEQTAKALGGDLTMKVTYEDFRGGGNEGCPADQG